MQYRATSIRLAAERKERMNRRLAAQIQAASIAKAMARAGLREAPGFSQREKTEFEEWLSQNPLPRYIPRLHEICD